MCLLKTPNNSVIDMSSVAEVYIDEEKGRFMLFAVCKYTNGKMFVTNCYRESMAKEYLNTIMEHWSKQTPWFELY